MNNDCKMVHGNVNLGTLFVTKSGDWKLGGFDILYTHGEPNDAVLQHRNIVPPTLRAPEFASNGGEGFDKGPAWAVDAWAVGCLIYELFNGPIDKPQQLMQPGKIPSPLLKDYKRLLATQPLQRLNPSKLLESPYFDNDLCRVNRVVIECSVNLFHSERDVP